MDQIIMATDVYNSSRLDTREDFMQLLDAYRQQNRADAWNEGAIAAGGVFNGVANPYYDDEEF